MNAADPFAPFRDPARVREILAEINHLAARLDRPRRFMEVCGTHTMAAARAGIHSLLPNNLRLSAGPGCPVCVTAPGFVAAAIGLARRPECIITTFGDMLRVPGGGWTLEEERARGADIRVVYSPLDALAIARAETKREVVFLGIGFETTAPAVAASILAAHREPLANYSVLVAHKTMPRAMQAILEYPGLSIDGFLCPGHVSAITGDAIYRFIPEEFGVPCAIAGFEPLDILLGLRSLIEQVVARSPTVANTYSRAVRRAGNPAARAVLEEVFEEADVEWRGLGMLPGSGLAIREHFAAHDAAKRFNVVIPELAPEAGCLCGDVLCGVVEPEECGLFGAACTPDHPVGPCMVSTEGACAAAWKYRRVTP